MNKRSVAVGVAAAVVMLMMPATALASPGAAHQPTPAASSAKGPSFNAKVAKCGAIKKTSSGTTESCTQIERVPLTDLTPAQLAQRQRDMAGFAARSKSRPAVPAQPTVTAPAQCNFSSIDFALSGVANPSRFVSCSDVLWTASVFEIVDGIPEPLGLFEWEDQSWNDYSVSSLSWTHGMQTIGYAGAFGVLGEGINAFLNSTCLDQPGICSATSLTGPDVQVVDIFPEETLSFEWDESDVGPASTTTRSVDDLTPSLGVDWLVTTEELGEAVETGDLAGRCDNEVGGTSGCVDQGFIPILFLSLAKYGAAAQMISFAQALDAHWGVQGVGSPLTRLANKATRNANRKAICRDGTFKRIATIGANDGDKDSCDEFPFAATNQSAGSTTTGASCAQVEAVSSGSVAVPPDEAADWPTVMPIGTFSTSAPCVRGHIPLKLNQGVGGAYGSFITANRLVNMDPFWVTVTL